MPKLIDVAPDLAKPKYRKSRAWVWRNCQVRQIKSSAGAPCSTHNELFAPWPGKEQFVDQWYVLDNGQAVGKGYDERGEACFSVIQFDSR